jgi:hypothetical protein
MPAMIEETERHLAVTEVQEEMIEMTEIEKKNRRAIGFVTL